ncbi:hypothetical protein CYJ16_05170 [Actinotignum timonense]|nr:hypothetical protein CYJ16_05170 [Actinotignum timonense]
MCEERQKTLFFAAVALKLTALLRRGRELEARNHPVVELGNRPVYGMAILVSLRGRGAGNRDSRSRTLPLSTRQALLRVACFNEATTRRGVRGAGVHIDNIEVSPPCG